MQLLLPGIIVFLDVDDLRAPRAQNPYRTREPYAVEEQLYTQMICHFTFYCPTGHRLAEDIGDLEGYVRATSVMLFFLSKKYFQSRNCLREIRASLEQEKP